MMISPKSYVSDLAGRPYLELIKSRDLLFDRIRAFEQKELEGDRSDPEWQYYPSPEVKYQVELEYLARLCEEMKDRYNQEFVRIDGWTLKQAAAEAAEK